MKTSVRAICAKT